MLAVMLLASAVTLPSSGNLALTCLIYAVLGYALARIRWWASLPVLLFLVLTLSATFKRLADLRATSPSAVLPPHYLTYHVGATALAVGVIVYAMREQRLRRRKRMEAEGRFAAV